MRFDNWVGAALFVGLVVPVQSVSADKFCEMAEKAGEGSSDSVLLVVDSGVGSSKEVKMNLAKGLLQLFNGLEPFDKVTVRQADSAFTAGSTVFQRCMPACPDPSIWDKFGIGKCDTMQVRKGTDSFRRGLVASAASLLSEDQAGQGSDLVSTLRTAERLSAPGSVIILFSGLRHSDGTHTPTDSADYDELFFDVVNGAGIPDLSGRQLKVFGYAPKEGLSNAELQSRRLFWDQFFLLGKLDQVLVGQYFQ